MGRNSARAVAAALTMMLFATACGGGGSDDTDAGGVVIQDISVETVDGSDITSEEPADETDDDASESGDEGNDDAAGENDADADTDGESTATTLPQADVNTPQEDLFDAIAVFQSCMEAEGIEFIGPPDPSLGDDAPQNQQPYIDSLILCATRSDIQNKLAAAQAAQADLTPEEIEEQNRTFLAFRDCMIGRGWTIPMPAPNENGVLFRFEITSEWEGPPGEELIDSQDVADCQTEAGVGDDD